MRKLFLTLAALVVLTGCGPVIKAYDIATKTTVSPEAVYIASNTFDALEITATKYLTLPRCTVPVTITVCRNPNATAHIIPAVQSGRKARNEARKFLREHPGELGAAGLYDGLQTAIGVIQFIFTEYGIK